MLKRGVQSLATSDRLDRYEDVFSLVPRESIEALFGDDALDRSNGHASLEYWREIMSQAERTDELGAFQLLEVRSSLPDELLMFADKMSMAHSLEARVPYLDRTVVEYAQRLGAQHKVRNGKGKWVHREVCRRFLPSQLLKRKKRGFAVNVVDGWFNSSVKSQLSDMLRDDDSRIFSILKPEPVRQLLAEHQAGRHDRYKLLFSLVILEQWMRGISLRQQRAQPELALVG